MENKRINLNICPFHPNLIVEMFECILIFLQTMSFMLLMLEYVDVFLSSFEDTEAERYGFWFKD